MSTTTVGDLLDRAELLARALRATRAEITTDQWRSFDATSYRLLHELVGPERTGNREQVISHATVSRILNGYPSPLSAPNPQVTYNARQVASHLGVSRATVAADIRRSRLPATYDGRRYSIRATDLPSITGVQPADPASTHPLDRLSCTLGVLADMAATERSRTSNIPGLDPLRDDAQVAPVMARVLATTVVAARHGLAHIPLQDADRPLAIAQYAERSLDAIGDVGRPSSLNRVASFAPPSSPRGPNEQLAAALRGWASLARREMARTVPSTEVLRNIANQARHLYAVSARLGEASFTNGHLPGQAAESIHEQLREAAQVMHALQQQWETVTTATRPGHEYVTATTTLHTSLSAIEREILLPGEEVDVTGRVDVDEALADLRYAATDLAELTHIGAQLPEPLIRSEQLFAPARILPSTMERVHDRNHGRYVAIRLVEGAALINAAREGSRAARQVRTALDPPSGLLRRLNPRHRPWPAGSRGMRWHPPQPSVDPTCSNTAVTCNTFRHAFQRPWCIPGRVGVMEVVASEDLNRAGPYGNSRTISARDTGEASCLSHTGRPRGSDRLRVALPAAHAKEDDMAAGSPVRRGHLTVVEVCAELGIARSTFYDWRAAGKAPVCFRLPNGGLRIRRSEFDRWLESLQESA